MEKKGKLENKKLFFEQAVGELEDLFVSKEKELYPALFSATKSFGTHKRYGIYKFVLAAMEKPLIESVLNRTGGNQFKAAQILGINRNTLHSKIKKLGIEVDRWKK
jgi:DNA-binding protein Fis